MIDKMVVRAEKQLPQVAMLCVCTRIIGSLPSLRPQVLK